MLNEVSPEMKPEVGFRVEKRTGTVVEWQQERIARAIALAFYDVMHRDKVNLHRNDANACYGLDEVTCAKVHALAEVVRVSLIEANPKEPVGIEVIQDMVETVLKRKGEWKVARAYRVFRQHKAESRMIHYPINGLSEYIAVSKYARYIPALRRREVFEEGAARVCNMHLDFYPNTTISGGHDPIVLETLEKTDRDLHRLIKLAFEGVANKEVLPSMRSMQFGGNAVFANHCRLFNCSFSYANRVDFFKEYFFLLLSGTGCGFSVQKHHVAMLPKLADALTTSAVHVAEDTIEGWGQCVKELITGFVNGVDVQFDLTLIRPEGAPLKTSGGKAPGPVPLSKALGAVRKVLKGALGRQLKPIEAYDMCMHISKAVLSGGIRRSASICLFSPDDEEMMNAKTGDWFATNGQRSCSNNSAVLIRGETTQETFLKLFNAQKEFGEPGFYFSDNTEYGTNPCCEIGLQPYITAEQFEMVMGHKPAQEGVLTGWQMCNLSTINGAKVDTPEHFYRMCVLASAIGTLQAGYTKMPYLGEVTEAINRLDSLLGVSICGFMDSPDILFDPAVLQRGAQICVETNQIMAQALGIRPASRITCVKPEGTASLLLGAASGIHPHHARRYKRRVQANRIEPVYVHFKQLNPQMTEPSVYNPDRDDMITFAVEAPDKAITRRDIDALNFLQKVKLVQENWVIPGTRPNRAPDLAHNVSNTCTVDQHEWEAVAAFIWENRACFTGISLLQSMGDKVYKQAPREEIATEQDIEDWNRIKYNVVDYTQMVEDSDKTELKAEPACAGGACELH